MSDYRASCQCGGLHVAASGEPDFIVLCNCKECQRRTGAPFGVGVYYRRDALQLSGGSSAWSRTVDAGRKLENHFCPKCGTNLWWTLELRPDHIGVALGAFDDQFAMPARAIWAEEKHDWVVFPDGMPVLPKATP